MRDAASEEPFHGVVGATLTAAVPLFNEMDEIVGVTLTFGEQSVSIRTWAGDIDTSPG